MKFALVNPGFLRGGMATVFKTPPLGLLYLAGSITRAGDHHVGIVDQPVHPRSDKQLSHLFNDVDVVGVTALTSTFTKALHYCRLAKEAGATTIMGGFQPTLMPDVARFPAIDAIVRGEGEVTMQDVVTKMATGEPWRQTRGVSYYDAKHQRLVHMPARPLMPDLDLLPMPRYDLIRPRDYKSLGFASNLVETSRGCTYGCEFCCVAKVYGRMWRTKSIDRVIKERRLLARESKWIFNVDDNYIMNPKRARRLSNRLVAEGLTDQRMIIQARADALARNPHLMDALAASGVRLVFIGVESIHPASLRRMNKSIGDVRLIQRAIEGLHARGIAVWASIMTGAEPTYPEARRALDLTLDFLHAHGVEIMQCTPYTAYPGTKFYDQAVGRGWVQAIDLEHPENTRLTPDREGFSRAQLIGLVKHAFRKFYLSPRYFFKLAKWKHLLKRNWLWVYSVITKFALVGFRDFLVGAVLNDDLWETQDLSHVTTDDGMLGAEVELPVETDDPPQPASLADRRR